MKQFILLVYITFIISQESETKDQYFNKLMKWFYDNGGVSLPLKLVKVSSSNRYLVPKRLIRQNEEIMFAPEKLIISYSNPEIKALCDTVFHKEKVIRLECIAYYVFLHINDMSHFFAPYFDYMSFDFKEYPMLYNEEDLKKLKNTNVHTRTQRQNKRVNDAFSDIMRHQNDASLNFDLYRNCFLFAMSRSFQKKMNDLPLSALVPFFELFNFIPGKINTHWDFIKERNGFILRARKDINIDEEIIVNYGRETNEDLLFKYGFTLENNSYKAYIDLLIDSQQGKSLIRLHSQTLEIIDVIMSMKGGNESKVSVQLEKLKELLQMLNERNDHYPSESEIESYENSIMNENIIRIIRDEQYAVRQFISLVNRFISDIENDEIDDIKRMQIRGMSAKYCKILLEIIERETKSQKALSELKQDKEDSTHKKSKDDL